MWPVIFVALWMVLPVVSLACLIVGLWRRGRCRTWLLVLALLPPLAWGAVLTAGTEPGGFPALPVWMAASVVLIGLAGLAARRHARLGRLTALVALATPAPLMAMVAWVGITEGVSGLVAALH